MLILATASHHFPSFRDFENALFISSCSLRHRGFAILARKPSSPWLWCHLEIAGGITTLSVVRMHFLLSHSSLISFVSLLTSRFGQISSHFLFSVQIFSSPLYSDSQVEFGAVLLIISPLIKIVHVRMKALCSAGQVGKGRGNPQSPTGEAVVWVRDRQVSFACYVCLYLPCLNFAE